MIWLALATLLALMVAAAPIYLFARLIAGVIAAAMNR